MAIPHSLGKAHKLVSPKLVRLEIDRIAKKPHALEVKKIVGVRSTPLPQNTPPSCF